MIYIFIGKDFNILNKRVDALISKLNINNIIRYDFDENNINIIIDEVNYVDLFNEKKLIIVTNFSFKKLKSEDEELFINYINHMNDNIIIFKCIDESIDERKKLTKLLREKCKIEECKKLDYKGLHEYVTNMFNDNKIKITYNQVKKILDLCEYNVDYTISEVDKLLLYKNGENEVSDKDIDDVISRNTEKEIFSFTENIMNKNIAGSIESYHILDESNIDSTIIVDSIAKQFRLLFQVKHLRNSMDELSLSRHLGVNPYVIKKLMPYINNYSDEEIMDILYKLSDIDYDLKVNGYDKNIIIESFLLKL